MFKNLKTKIMKDSGESQKFLHSLFLKHYTEIESCFALIREIIKIDSSRKGKNKLLSRSTRPYISPADMFILFLISKEFAHDDAIYYEVGTKFAWSMMTTSLAIKHNTNMTFKTFECNRDKRLKRIIQNRNKAVGNIASTLFEDGFKQLMKEDKIDQLFVDAYHSYKFATKYLALDPMGKLNDKGRFHVHDFHINPPYKKMSKNNSGESHAVAEWYNKNKLHIDENYLCIYAGNLINDDCDYKKIMASDHKNNFFTRNNIDTKFWLHGFLSSFERFPLFGSLWFINRNLV